MQSPLPKGRNFIGDMFMKKVLYTVTKVGKETTKVSGLGYITDKDLITAQISKNGNAYIRVYEDCVTDCHKIAGKDNE